MLHFKLRPLSVLVDKKTNKQTLIISSFSMFVSNLLFFFHQVILKLFSNFAMTRQIETIYPYKNYNDNLQIGHRLREISKEVTARVR